MQTLIAFLRGINMTGHNSVKMIDLSHLFAGLGFTDAETYIQSGNVIFSSTGKESVQEISLRIEKAILERFNYIIPVLIRTVQELKDIVYSDPFVNEENFDPAKLAVIFLQEKCKISQIQKVKDIDYPPDKFKISGREIFIHCPNGFGRTKLYTNFFEKKMGVTGTARNWKTVTAILNVVDKKQRDA
jgi:uncharacterized protein (DUF1697 family)